jgi:peptidoglycan/xylan/chitin deacetylase (PgdA/CDA1 family)
MNYFYVAIAVAAAVGGLFVYACSVPAWRFPVPVIVRGDRQAGRIALTFDDGPAPPYTDQILDLLRERQVKATFFLCGRNVEKYPELARRICQQGHTLGNHTYSHPFLYFRRRHFMAKEIDRTQQAIEKATGARPQFFRPPYGVRWPGLHRVLRERGMRLVNWSDTGYDWKFDTERIAREALRHLGSGSIILLHDGLETRPPRPVDQTRTVRALPAIIDQARQAGLSFVTLDELLGQGPQRAEV